MLTALLKWPVALSHQYTPSTNCFPVTLHVGPIIEPQAVQRVRKPEEETLLTVHAVESPAQLSSTDMASVIKCCVWSGLTERDAAGCESGGKKRILIFNEERT